MLKSGVSQQVKSRLSFFVLSSSLADFSQRPLNKAQNPSFPSCLAIGILPLPTHELFVAWSFTPPRRGDSTLSKLLWAVGRWQCLLCGTKSRAMQQEPTGSGVKPWGNHIPRIFQLFNPPLGLLPGVMALALMLKVSLQIPACQARSDPSTERYGGRGCLQTFLTETLCW